MFRHFCAHAQKSLGEFECKKRRFVDKGGLVGKDWQIGLFANLK